MKFHTLEVSGRRLLIQDMRDGAHKEIWQHALSKRKPGLHKLSNVGVFTGAAQNQNHNNVAVVIKELAQDTKQPGSNLGLFHSKDFHFPSHPYLYWAYSSEFRFDAFNCVASQRNHGGKTYLSLRTLYPIAQNVIRATFHS